VTGAVVYIDDEPAICRIFRWHLEAAGLSVETFTDVEAALAWIRDNPVRCILCDHRMPLMSGLELHDRLGGEVPFWVVTGDLSVDDEVADRADIRGVLHKPIDFGEVIALVRDLD
jgi:DNA-binding NtrC family response regulator